MSDRFKRMYEIPLQDVMDFCRKCDLFKKAYLEKENGQLSTDTLGDLRKKCTCCRGIGNNGIYKADALLGVLGAISPSKRVLPAGKGRRSVIPKSVIAAILEQNKQGLSAREIARRTGYSQPTISKIIKQERGKMGF